MAIWFKNAPLQRENQQEQIKTEPQKLQQTVELPEKLLHDVKVTKEVNLKFLHIK